MKLLGNIFEVPNLQAVLLPPYENYLKLSSVETIEKTSQRFVIRLILTLQIDMQTTIQSFTIRNGSP